MGKRSRQNDTVSEPSSEDLFTTAASPAKLQEVEVDNDDTSGNGKMECALPPHQPQTFASINDFDVHYVQEHTNRCSSCGKNFPSALYLTLHIDENHNPMREVLATQGERTYACFVQDCDRKCSTPQKRRLHLIDKHMFPKAYNFRIVDYGIDRTGSLLLAGQRRRLSTNVQTGHQRRVSYTQVSHLPPNTSISSASTEPPKSDTSVATTSKVPNSITEDKVDDLEKSFAALQFVPPSVQARRRNKKTEN